MNSENKPKKRDNKTKTKAIIETSSNSGSSNKDLKDIIPETNKKSDKPEDESKTISDRSQMFLSLIYDLPPSEDEDDNSELHCILFKRKFY